MPCCCPRRHSKGPLGILCVAGSLGSVDFVEEGTGIVVFRTCDQEKEHVVFQIGTADPTRALAAAQIV